MKSIRFLLPLAALALSGMAAASSRVTESVVVRYGDLNLQSRAGVVGLHKRIRNAAQKVCGNIHSRVPGFSDAFEKCVDESLARAVATVGNPGLSDFHAHKGKSAVFASS